MTVGTDTEKPGLFKNPMKTCRTKKKKEKKRESSAASAQLQHKHPETLSQTDQNDHRTQHLHLLVSRNQSQH